MKQCKAWVPLFHANLHPPTLSLKRLLSQTQTKELFRRRRWRLVLAQFRNKVGKYSSWKVFILHSNSFPLGPMVPTTSLHLLRPKSSMFKWTLSCLEKRERERSRQTFNMHPLKFGWQMANGVWSPFLRLVQFLLLMVTFKLKFVSNLG